MKMIKVGQIKDKCRPGAVAVTINSGDRVQQIELHREKSGCCDRLFFICPWCGRKAAVLYLSRIGWTCRNCCPVSPYHGIQKTTKGGDDEIGYRMKRYAALHGIQFDFPFDYLAFVQDDRISKASFRKHLKVLQALENMRFNAWYLGERFTAAQIRQVVTGKHILMDGCTLQDLRNNVYDWKQYQNRGRQ